MMRRQLLLCSAIAALLSSPAQAQYVDRYKTSERPQVEVNLDVLNERQEQEYHAQTDVAQEPLPVSQPAAEEPQTVEAMPEPAVPAQKRKLLKPVLTTPVAQEETPEEETAAAPEAQSKGVTPDGEMPPTQTIVKHVIIKSYSPVDDMPVPQSAAQSAAVDEIYREAAIEDMAASITPVEEPLPLPRRKPVMGEAKAEPVRMAALANKAAAAPVIADDVPATQTPETEQKDEPKIEVAATEIAPDVKAEEPKAEEPKSEEPRTDEKQPEQAAADPIAAPVQMAQADIPSPVTPQPARNRIISQPPRLKEQTLQPLLPRTAPVGKPIVSVPPDVAAPAHTAAPVVPKIAAQPVAPVAADPLPESVPVAPVEQAAPPAPVAAAPAPAAEPETPAQQRPSLEIVGAPLADVNAPSDPAEAAMPVVPVIDDLTLNFPGNSSDLTGESQKKLDAVIQQMNGMIEGRLQVRGYAAGEDGSQSSARRIALSRALAVRSYMMDKGIKPTRVDVKAAGNETDRQPLDRVDLIFAR